MTPITYLETPFHEKFGVPRQSLLVPEAWGRMRFPKNNFFSEAFRGIEQSSHLWIIFEFHQVPNEHFQGLVRPPRFENKLKMGVYATRSPHRPNRIGISVVEFEKIKVAEKEIILHVKGVDLVDKTPVFDIKPYVPYADRIDAVSPFTERPVFKEVRWSCAEVPEKELIEKVIALDPRPAYDRETETEFGISIAGYNVRFRALLNHFEIITAIALE